MDRNTIMMGVLGCGLFGLAAPGCDGQLVDPYVDPAANDGPGDIESRLESIDGLVIVAERSSHHSGYRFFELEYRQPADHADPDGPAFGQRLTLMHRDSSAPMILHTTGYQLREGPFLGEPTAIVGGNQLTVEQRYFGPSNPDDGWEHMSTRQAADDHHRLVQALRAIYSGAWIATGGSKGGKTALIHERHHPNDLDAVVAYVAPISLGAPDHRYTAFFDTVGTAPCRERVRDLQRELLERREQMLERFENRADIEGVGFTRRSAEVSLEWRIVDLEWKFWQYFGRPHCSSVPSRSASNRDLFDALMRYTLAASWGFGDDRIARFETYYYQTFRDMGHPAPVDDHLADLLEFRDLDIRSTFIPAGIPMPTYDPQPMRDVHDWIDQNGERIMLIYGEDDPWTAGAFSLSGASDSHVYTVESGTHLVDISDLPSDERSEAVDILRGWAGLGGGGPANDFDAPGPPFAPASVETRMTP